MKKADPSPRNRCICIRLRRIANKATEYYDRALEPVGLSINQYSLLVNISRMEGCGIGELARRVGLEKSTLVRTLRPLLRAGLIADASRTGERRRQLRLTPAGKETLKKALPLWAGAQKAIADKLGEDGERLLDIFETVEL